MLDLIFGRKVCLETLELNSKRIKKIYATEKTAPLINEKNNAKVIIKSMHFLDKLVDNQNHQGLICEVSPFEYLELTTSLIQKSKRILILDHLQDPANFGAVLRSAECFNVDLVIIPKDRSVRVNGTVTKTSMGATERLKIVQVSNLSVAIKKLKDNDFWIYATGLQTKTSINDVSFAAKSAIIIGNENKGVSPIIQKNSDLVMKIDMQGTLNSLNVSVATGIVLYEVSKKQE